VLTYSPEISRCVDNKTLFEPIEYKKVTYACQTETLPNLDQQMQNFGEAGALPRLLLQKSPFPARQCVPAQSHPTICLPAIPFLDSFPLSSWIEMLINRNVVLSEGREGNLVSRNDLGERLIASPAVSNSRLFIRSDGSLFCIGEEGQGRQDSTARRH